MKPQTFLDHFERLTDAPQSIARLRELILQLAVQGKLVEQDEHDEPAVRLLERIAAERMRLIREKKIKEAKPLPPVSDEEAAFALPSNWAWTRLGELAQASDYGTSQKASEFIEGVPVLRMNNIIGGRVTFDNLKYLPTTLDELPRLYVKYNDLLFNRTNSYELVGKTGIFKGKDNTVTFASYLIRLTLFLNHVDADFINLVMNSAYYRQTQIEPEITQQTNQANFNGTKLANTFLPFPPLEEQKRIVAKADELMRLCDELERRQAERREAAQRLNRAALDQLLVAPDAAEFQLRWHTACDHFTTLTATPDLLGKLRQIVLQLAVQGKLTRQDPKDEPATSLLRRIRAERERLVKEKRLNCSDPLPPVNSDETPFAVPSGWMWTRFSEVATIASNLVQPDGYPDFLHVAPDNIEKQTGRLLACRTIREDEVRSANHLFYSGQLVYSKIRPNLSKAVIVDFDGLCSADMYPINAHINVNFLLKYMLSSTFLSMAVKSDTRVAMPKINQDELNKILVAVPPLEEQKRIVAAVNQLMALCDELEAGLRRAEENSEQLLRAAVRSLLNASISEDSSAEAAALVVH